MIVLVDIGNTRVKWCQWYGSDCHHHGEAVSETLLDNEWAVAFTNIDKPDRVIACCVGKAHILLSLEKWVKQNWDIEVDVITTSATACGVHNGYVIPTQLGVDRWAAMVAAYVACKRGVCVVDCGTAVTVDVIEPSGRHLGGLILPGKRLMKSALVGNTALIDSSYAVSSKGYLGDETSSCIDFAAYQATVGMIERVVTHYNAVFQGALCCYLTGGDAMDYMTGLRGDWHHEPDLVLKGIACVAGVME